MLVLIIAVIVASGLIAYAVSKSKSSVSSVQNEELVIPIVVEEQKPKKELKLKEKKVPVEKKPVEKAQKKSTQKKVVDTKKTSAKKPNKNK